MAFAHKGWHIGQQRVEKFLRALSSELLCHSWRQRRDSNPRPRALQAVIPPAFAVCTKNSFYISPPEYFRRPRMSGSVADKHEKKRF